ncbi:hypothetical protein B566_EDAN005559 [Ephemera danica]|nr:hypothetical protein B566_EDAN005559 [Ephemera danica]
MKLLIDPSELLRPEPEFAAKPVAKFRDYTIDPDDHIKERVRRTYQVMHRSQTVEFVKVMAFYDEPQWAVVGDTFPVGCLWGDSIVYRADSFQGNPDGDDPRYNTECGMYERHCGLEKVDMSWGHDEYLYRMLVHNKVDLPEEALYMVSRYDLYTKSAEVPDVEAITPYYQSIIDKYMPGQLSW